MAAFIAIGENIHCSRTLKIDGGLVATQEDGTQAILFSDENGRHALPVPSEATEFEEWTKGKKVKHAAVAIKQGMDGDDAVKPIALAYLRQMAAAQATNGAAFLDVNVDEYSTNPAEKARAMQWVARVIQDACSVPLSIDSSEIDLLKAGLDACDASRAKMVNSVSLERQAAIQVARDAGAVVIAGATGGETMPTTVEERLHNFDQLIPQLRAVGFDDAEIYLDPLVFPVSVDTSNGKKVLETIAQIRLKYGQSIHIAPGLSNISFGVPNRKLLNIVFTYLCVESGCDAGIVDPRHINADALNALDTGSEGFKLAKAFLLGEDQFGMNYIRAARKGLI